jgi:hypothetical protein
MSVAEALAPCDSTKVLTAISDKTGASFGAIFRICVFILYAISKD